MREIHQRSASVAMDCLVEAARVNEQLNQSVLAASGVATAIESAKKELYQSMNEIGIEMVKRIAYRKLADHLDPVLFESKKGRFHFVVRNSLANQMFFMLASSVLASLITVGLFSFFRQ